MYGDGKQKRDWFYVKDRVKAIDLLIEKGEISEAYNVVGKSNKENILIVNRILEIKGKPKDLINHIKDRPGYDLRYLINDTKIRELGFK